MCIQVCLIEYIGRYVYCMWYSVYKYLRCMIYSVVYRVCVSIQGICECLCIQCILYRVYNVFGGVYVVLAFCCICNTITLRNILYNIDTRYIDFFHIFPGVSPRKNSYTNFCYHMPYCQIAQKRVGVGYGFWLFCTNENPMQLSQTTNA